MPFCQNCGVQVSDDANFCFSCGKLTVKITTTKKDLIPKNSSNGIINTERKRKWTDNALIEEYYKYGSIDEFKKSKYNVWLIFKQRKLNDKLGILEQSSLFIKVPHKEDSKKTKQISVLEYSKKINPSYFRKNRKDPSMPITRHTIMYRIRNNMTLPEVIRYLRVGKVHVLTVSADF
jgi:hypothetical protein